MAAERIKQISDAEWERLLEQGRRTGPVRPAPQSAPRNAPVPTTGTLPPGTTIVRDVVLSDEPKDKHS